MFIIYVRKITNFREMYLKYFVKEKKPDFDFTLPEIRRYITTQNRLQCFG